MNARHDSIADSQLRRLRRRRVADFEVFYREHYAFVWRSARHLLAGRSESDVEDLLQETFTVAYRRFGSYQPEACAPTTWLFGIVRNVARNHARGDGRRERKHAALAHAAQSNEATERGGQPLDEALLARRMLDDFLAGLDPDKRAAFVLVELEGFTGRELAAALGVNANTASSRLRAARKAFCEHFELPRGAIGKRTAPLRSLAPCPDAPTRTQAALWPALGLPLSTSAALVGTLPALGLTTFAAKLGAASLGILLVGLGLLAGVTLETEAQAEAATERERARIDRQRGALAAQARRPAPPREATVEPPALVEAPPEAPAPDEARPAERSRPALVDPHERFRQARAQLVAGQPEATLRTLASLSPAEARRAGLAGARASTLIAARCRLNQGPEARRVYDALPTQLDAGQERDALLARLDHACW